MNIIDRDGMIELLRRSIAVGTERADDGEEMVRWRTDDGEEFHTTLDDAVEYGSYPKRSLHVDKWRVCRIRPHAWGIWPPDWDLECTPLLMYMTHAQAFKAAHDRAGFAATPPVPQEEWQCNGVFP